MILIDTSVWIEFFRRNGEYPTRVLDLLENKQVVAYEPVFAELLYGARSRKDRDRILSFWELLPRIEFGSGSLMKAAEMAGREEYLQSGIGMIDAAIIQAVLDGNHQLWTLDKKITGRLDPDRLYKQIYK
jgi:predicted nucleic acid-binding protein